MLLRIREWRHRAGMSQEVLATQAGMSRQHLSALETGRYTADVQDLEKVAAALQLRVSDLLDDRCPVCPYRHKPPPGPPETEEPTPCQTPYMAEMTRIKDHHRAAHRHSQRIRLLLARGLHTASVLLALGLV